MLLLDEPTASLTPSEAQVLFRILRKLRDDGVAIGFVSHKLEEVFDICDTVTVLRDGRNACDSAALKSLNRAGRGADDDRPRRAHLAARARGRSPTAAPFFELQNYSSAAGHENISLSVRPGEILGLYGLVGAGRSELGEGRAGAFDADGRRDRGRGQAGEDRLGGRGAATSASAM